MNAGNADHLTDQLQSLFNDDPVREPAVETLLRDRHPADIAEAMESLARPDALAVFEIVDDERAGDVLDELDPDMVRYLVGQASPERIADLLDRLPMDDAAEVVAEADPEQKSLLLSRLNERAPADAEEVRELLSYKEGTAGRLMTDKFVRLSARLTVEEAFTAIRHADPDVETLTDLYVVDPVQEGNRREERLIGVLSLRDLVRAAPDRGIDEVMARDLITVSVDTDQEDVARLIEKYDCLALPVLDRNGYLAGIITVDDVVDILLEEDTEDYLRLGAVESNERPYLSMGVMGTVRQRFGWLLLLFVAETATGFVLRHFEDEISRAVALSFFVPLLIGTGGNAGAQTVTTITRALALGELRYKDGLRVLWRETRTGMLLGGMLATVGFIRALLWGTGTQLALVVALSMVVIVIWANTVGSLLPIFAKRLGFDPAVMSAPFITTLVDATGLFFYFSIARVLLNL
ncbi:MAG: magnesium transporter [Armatimonadetes bacterium]|nr:magnesium transporter [Armatimonadota bacterium]